MKPFLTPTVRRLFSPTRLTVVTVIALIICMIIFPTATLAASKTGLAAWWNIIFPALLPFFISSELLTGYGVIQFMGVIMEPVMRPLFNLPGAASFVLAIGYTSGFPISAALTARLRREHLCTRREAERLMSFTNNASPLFLLVAVGVGMFGSARLGVLLALTHYAANLTLGLLLRFYKPHDPEHKPVFLLRQNLFSQAFTKMQQTYRADPRPLGRMLGDAISASVNKLLVIGGFVIIFSVLIKISVLTGIMSGVTGVLNLAAAPLGFTGQSVQALGFGFFEITLGAKAAAEAAVPLWQRAVAAAVILGWSGVSVIAQVSAMISGTDLRMGLFAACRFLHALLAGLYCFLLLSSSTVTSWLAAPVNAGTVVHLVNPGWFGTLAYFTRICLIALGCWVFLGIVVYFCRSFSLIIFKAR